MTRNPKGTLASKYGEEGLFSKDSFNIEGLPEASKEKLAKTANYILSKSTWSTYTTTKNHLKACQEETGSNMDLPLSQEKIIMFLTWLLQERSIKGTTAESYISGLRAIHQAQGLPVPMMRPDIVKSILSGAKHQDSIEDRINPKSKRLPMTLTALRVLKNELSSQNLNKIDIRMIWAVACLAFYGSLRMGELLTEKADEYDANFTCMTEDIEIVQGTVQIRLKNPKEDKSGKDIIVDIFRNDKDCCPTRALEKWWSMKPPRAVNKPAFRFADGGALSKRCFNKIIARCMNHHVPEGEGFYSGHSFRAGIPSMLGEMGYSDEDIMSVGRWSSSAYETYVKMPRTRRQEMARRIATWEA